MKQSLDSLKKLIPSSILAKGKQCLINNQLLNVEKYKTSYIANIKGTDLYTVNIDFSKHGQLLTHACNCPYSQGAICKHKAALVLALEETIKNNIPIESGQITILADQLSPLTKDVLIQVIVDIAKSDVNLKMAIAKYVNQL